jgi:hypothetical protein
MAAIPQADSLAALVPIKTASFLKNCLSSSVVSTPKKWVKTPMMVSSSSVGSLKGQLPGITISIWNSPLHQTQESSVEGISLLELVGVLSQEQVSSVDKIADDQSEDLSQIQTRDHLLERLSSAV